jgi:hypothetical protein
MKPASAPHAESTKPAFGFMTRLLMKPTLVHINVAQHCPDGDIRIISALGVLMLLSGAWECVLFSNAARVMLSPDGTWQVTFVALGLLIAAIILLADAIVFIAASWHAHGLAEVERTHEFKLPTTQVGRLKNASLFGGRFLMTVLIANFMAVTTGLLAFEKDINRVLERDYQNVNAALLKEGSQREDAELQKSKDAQQNLAGLIAQLEVEERSLRSLNLTPKVDEAGPRLAQQRVASAQAVKAAADRELNNAGIHSARERGGDCDARTSCVAGEGPRWRAAQERLAAAQQQASTAARALDDAQKRLRELTEKRDDELRHKETLAGTHLADVGRRKAHLEQQLAGLGTAYDKRLSSREVTVRAMVEHDPRHTPRNDGLLVRLQALKELSKDESIAYALYGFDAILMLLELAAIMGKTFALIPMTYATRIVELDLARAIETAKRLKALMDSSKRTEPAPIEVTPQTSEPTVGKSPGANELRPTNGVDRSPRHQPRWRPSLQDEPSKKN